MAKEPGEATTAEQDPPPVTDDQVFEPDDPDLGQAVLDAAHEAAQRAPTPTPTAETKPDDAKSVAQAPDLPERVRSQTGPAPAAKDPDPEPAAGHDRDKGLQRLQQRVEDQGRTIGQLSDTLTQGFDRLTELVTTSRQTPAPDAANGDGKETPAQEAEVQSIDQIVKGIDPFDEESLAKGLTEVAKVAEGNASKAVQTQLKEIQDTMSEIKESATAPQREVAQKQANDRVIQSWIEDTGLKREDFDRLVDEACEFVTASGNVDPEKDPQKYKDQVTGAFSLLTQQAKPTAKPAAGDLPERVRSQTGPKPAPARTTPADTAGTQIVQDGARTTQTPPSTLNMHDDLPIDAMDANPSDMWEE